MLVDDLHERAAVVVGAAVVDADDDVALLRQPLRPAACCELIVDLLRARSAVDVEDDGVALVGIERNRLDDAAVYSGAVGCRERENLGRRVGVGLEPFRHRRVVLHRAQLLARGRPELHLRRLLERRITVEEERRRRRHVDAVISFRRRDASLIAAVEPDGVELALKRRHLCRGVVDRLLFCVAPLDPRHAPVSVSHLVDELSGIVVAVEMLESVAIGEPEELVRIRRERHHVIDARVEVIDIEPGLRCLGHHLAPAAGLHIEEEELHHVLRAVERDHGEGVRPARPVNARNVELAFLTRIEPRILARGDVHDANAHRRVRVADLRNVQLLPLLMQARVVGDLDLGFRRIVQLPVGDVTALGRPLPRLREPVLLLVHPVEVAVVDVLRRIPRQPLLLVRREIGDVHVTASLESEHRAIGRELTGSRPLGGELHAALRKRVDVEIGDPRPAEDRLEVRLKDEVPGVLRPLERVVAERLIRSRKREACCGEENRVSSAGGVVGMNDRRAGARIAFRVGEPHSPFYPVHVARSLSAVENGARLHCLVHVREPLLLLSAGDQG